ncbi:protein GAMETOPHYTE DEFECTIVE 1 [Lotus japonicus]|uniref:protein GAMETOPHYTE DEFECTIVE 1 n=1 Tax=Lotus japonicus TaxID=34305 RepID=UPI00258E3305|nr:protein GAMETOPHYTE DEFECTIVE 1 [Lotus japonicus]
MGFFDLNIPYPESTRATKSTVESTRTKLAVKAMELGYTGIAYNRTIKGVMSDQHRCSITTLSLSSLLNILPVLTSSAKLHRNLLGIPSSTPFRQYTRLTVCVDNPSQAQSLNAGNPILKTYDLVAVKPSNQVAFDLACERMEVDIISIDFSTKLPFRLKLPMVKAATQRGVCFEVTYSGLIADVQIRRLLISNAKLLMDWTRGQNLVFSSGAPSVNELRGPCDVANLLSLFGLSKEQAKAAISKNCRILLANSLRKKRFFKEAIRVEALPTNAESHSNEAWHQELLKWDPISSGEGDILLDDMEKPCKASCKAIDFDSLMAGLSSKGFRIQDSLSTNKVSPVFPNNKVNFLPVTNKENQLTPLLNNVTEQPNRLDICPEQHESSLSVDITTRRVSCDTFSEKNLQCETTEAFNSKEETDTETNATKLEERLIDSDVPMDDMEKSFSTSCETSKTAEDIDFVSVDNSLPSHDFRTMDFLPANYVYPILPCNKGSLLPVSGKVNQSSPVSDNSTELPNKHDVCPQQDERSLYDKKDMHSGTIEAFNSKKEIDTQTNATKLEKLNFIDSDVNVKALDSQSDLCISSDGVLDTVKSHENGKLVRSSDDPKLGSASNDHTEEIFTPPTNIKFPALVLDKHNNEKSSDVNLNAKIVKIQEILPSEDSEVAENMVLEIKTSTHETSVEDALFDKRETDAVELDEMPQQTPFDEMQTEGDDTVPTMHLLPVTMEDNNKLGEMSTDSQFAAGQALSGRLRVKRRTSRGPLLFPLKRLLNQMPFKKKGKKIKNRIKLK